MTLNMKLQEQFKEGRAEGRAEGTERMATLIQKLLEAERYDDIKAASNDTLDREKLFKEFNL